MHLMHNHAFRLTTEALGLPEGIFRIVVDDSSTDITYCVLIKQESPRINVRGGRPRIEVQKLKRKKRIPQKSVPRRFVWNLTARIHRSGARWGLWATRQSELSTNPRGGVLCQGGLQDGCGH